MTRDLYDVGVLAGNAGAKQLEGAAFFHHQIEPDFLCGAQDGRLFCLVVEGIFSPRAAAMNTRLSRLGEGAAGSRTLPMRRTGQKTMSSASAQCWPSDASSSQGASRKARAVALLSCLPTANSITSGAVAYASTRLKNCSGPLIQSYICLPSASSGEPAGLSPRASA